MTPSNFKWYLHTLLFLHTQDVIKIQMAKAERQNEDVDDDSDDDGINLEEDE
jgi:hypothetical protein